MTVFKNREMMEEIFSEIWNELILETELGRTLRDKSISVLYKITDLGMVMYIDENGAIFGNAAETKKAVITESMSSETAHKLWLKKLNMPDAMASQQIRAKGSATKLLQILPLLERVREVYPKYCIKYDLPMD